MLRCPLFDCVVYAGCFIMCCERPCQRCPSSPFHKSASCHDGVAFIIRLWFRRPGPWAAGEHWLSHSASRRGERWEDRRWVLSPCLCDKAPLKPQCLGIWAHDASPPSSTSKPRLRKQLAVKGWNRKWCRNGKYSRVYANSRSREVKG